MYNHTYYFLKLKEKMMQNRITYLKEKPLNSYHEILSQLKSNAKKRMPQAIHYPALTSLKVALCFLQLIETAKADDDWYYPGFIKKEFFIDNYPFALDINNDEAFRFDKALTALQNNICGTYNISTDINSPAIETISRYGDCEQDVYIYAELFKSFREAAPKSIEDCMRNLIFDSIKFYENIPYHRNGTEINNQTLTSNLLTESQNNNNAFNWQALLGTVIGTIIFVATIAIFIRCLRQTQKQNGVPEKESLLLEDAQQKKSNAEKISSTNAPKPYICKLTGKLMTHPITIDDGKSYEKEALEKWMRIHNYCPSNKRIKITVKIPNLNLKNTIDTYVENELKKQSALMQKKNSLRK